MTIREEISQLRARIADLKAERETIEAQRRSRKEIAAQIEGELARWSADADAIIKARMARAAAGYPAEFLTVHVRGTALDLGPLFVHLLGPDTVRKALGKGLATVPEGLAPLARVQRQREISDALHQSQIEEENLIREAEQIGEKVPYRADADPAYTLTWRPQE
jgi:cell division septum initiation protein DivIVA